MTFLSTPVGLGRWRATAISSIGSSHGRKNKSAAGRAVRFRKFACNRGYLRRNRFQLCREPAERYSSFVSAAAEAGPNAPLRSSRPPQSLRENREPRLHLLWSATAPG